MLGIEELLDWKHSARDDHEPKAMNVDPKVPELSTVSNPSCQGHRVKGPLVLAIIEAGSNS
jgi:hypothetical protein